MELGGEGRAHGRAWGRGRPPGGTTAGSEV
jgi:hypothetical protein